MIPFILISLVASRPVRLEVQYSEKRICTIASPPVDGEVLLSPDLRHVLYVEKKGDKQCAVLDGIEEQPYDEIRPFMLIFSPDSRRHAYAARAAGKTVVVVDGMQQGTYQSVEYSQLIFSPDSRRTAWIARVDDDHSRVIVDGVDGPLFQDIRDLAFSPDSKHFTYVRSRRENFEERDVRAVQDHVDLAAGQVRVIYSADAANPAIILQHGKRVALQFRGTISKDYDGIDTKTMRFSPDNKRVAFWAIDGDDWRVVVDGTEHKPHGRTMFPMQPGDMEPLLWSADSRHIAYPVGNCVVLDGKEQKSYGHVMYDTVSFSPDGQRLAYAASADRDYRAIVEDVEGKLYPQVNRPEFSPDSKRVGYFIWTGQPEDRWQAVIDGKEGQKYEEVGGARWSIDDGRGVFSPDSKHFLYKAMRDGKWRIVVDDIEGPAYDEFPKRDPITFDSPNSFHLIARRGMDYVVIEGRIPG